MKLPAALALLALLAPAGAQDESPPPDARVIRCVLDRQCRALVVPLGDGLWAAWDTQACTLMKVWQGDVSWDGPVYTTVHGPQPTSRGADLNDPLVGASWEATAQGTTQPVRASFEGYDAPADGPVTLHWKLVLGDGEQVHVCEVPERLAPAADGHPRLQRTFTPTASDASTQLQLVARDRPVAAEANDPGGDARFDLITVEESPALPNARAPHVDAYVQLWSDRPSHVVVTYAPPAPAAATDTPDTAALEPPPTPGPSAEQRRAALLAPPHALSDDARFEPGIALRLYALDVPLDHIAPLVAGQTPNVDVLLSTLDLDGDRGDFAALGGPDDTFLAQATARLRVDEAGEYGLRLISDDGSRLSVDGQPLIDHDGLHSAEPKDATLALTAGEHELEAWMFENYGGEVFALQWKPPGAADFAPIPPERLSSPAGIVRVTSPGPKRIVTPLRRGRPGDGEWLAGVHPSFELHAARPPDFEPKVGGLALRQDGALLVSTWNRDGAVYALTDANCDDANQIRVQRIASGLAEPLGLCTVGWRTFVMQKQELTELIDHDGDGVTDEYRCLCNAWPVSPNFHEFGFGLVERDGWLYANLAIAIDPGGRSSMKQAEGRGAAIRVDADDGRFELLAQGLRAPNGIGFGADLGWTPRSGEPDSRPIFIADNQGDWLPSSKILLLQPGAFYGNRSVLREKADGLHDAPPVAWLPQDEIGNSPSQPAPLDVGPWVGQMIVGDVTHGGLQRIAVDRVGDALNGCVFAFSQGLEAGVNRLCWDRSGGRKVADVIGRDLGISDIDFAGLDPVTRRTSLWTNGVGAELYVGGIGSTGNWGQEGKLKYGLQRLHYTGAPCLEMLNVRARHDGLLVELTEHLVDGLGTNPDGWLVQSWCYEPTDSYGGPKLDLREEHVTAVTPIDNGTALFLHLPMPEAGRVVYVRALDPLRSREGHGLWSTEAWLTLNAVPDEAGPPAVAAARDDGPLTDALRAEGWRPLFDGHDASAWHTLGATPLADGSYPPPTGWTVQDGALVRTGDGGDLVSNDAFRDFELELDWRITPGGNSGIFFLVDETPRADGSQPAVWETGIEMQVLDDQRHADGQNPLTSAGACYGLFAPERDDTRPVGHWNHVRIGKQGSRVEQWLNGRLQCAYDIGSDDWKARVAASKFRSMPGFAKMKNGHIALQDHGDEVAFRNIRIHDLSY